MSDGKFIRPRGEQGADAPGSTGSVVAKVVPLRSANDRRGAYPELRALIDAGRDLEVFFEPTD